jgi:hypothetical protein
MICHDLASEYDCRDTSRVWIKCKKYSSFMPLSAWMSVDLPANSARQSLKKPLMMSDFRLIRLFGAVENFC